MKRIAIFLALAATGGALYLTVAANTTARAAPEVRAAKAPPPHLKFPAGKRHMETLPPLTKLDLQSLPPDAIPMEFNGGVVYWIPLDEKIPAQSKTSPRKAS